MLAAQKRSAPSQSHEWNSSGEYSEFSGTENEPRTGNRLEVRVEREWIVPDICFSFASLQWGGRDRVEYMKSKRLMDVVFDVSADAEKPCLHVKKVEGF